jgi:hypothetical protein
MKPRAGRRLRLSFTDRLLITLVHLRLGLPYAALAVAFGVDRSTVTRAIGQVWPLPAGRGFATHTGIHGIRLRELVRVAGTRWSVEELFQTAKNETGLDHYQVRRYDAWYAHITLSMAALAFLAPHPRCRARRSHRRRGVKSGAGPQANELIPLSSNEIRRLIAKLTQVGRAGMDHVLRWSTWRRRRQAQARTSHYKQRLDLFRSGDGIGGRHHRAS